MNKSAEFLKEYVNTPSPSGYEMILGGQQVWIDYVKEYCGDVQTDNYGNAYAYSKCNPFVATKRTLLLDAHCDEIGFFVDIITDEGFIVVGTLGGSDITIAPSSRVNIWVDRNKPISGVFGHPAIHVHKRDFKAELHKTFIDIGVSSKEEVLDLGIEVGTPITMVDGYMELGKYHCGRALDDKIGGYITSQVLRKLHETEVKLSFNLVVVNAVQEEVGLYGAAIAANEIKPDMAVAIDVCHDTASPAYDKGKQGHTTAGKGAVLMNAPSIHKKVFGMLKKAAVDSHIPYQITASGGSSGTNADSYAYPQGIPTGLVKLAMRYMHTTVESVHKDDVDACIDLLYTFIVNLDLTESLKY